VAAKNLWSKILFETDMKWLGNLPSRTCMLSMAESYVFGSGRNHVASEKVAASTCIEAMALFTQARKAKAVEHVGLIVVR
jgi:hypothetical protein